MVAVALYRVGLDALADPAVQLFRVGLDGSVVTQPQTQLFRIGLTGTVAVTVNDLPTRNKVEPGSLQPVTASTADGTTPDSWTWRVISGPGLLESGSGDTRNVRMIGLVTPGVAPPTGTTTVIGVTATKGATTSPEKTLTFNVLPELIGTRAPGGSWLGASRS